MNLTKQNDYEINTDYMTMMPEGTDPRFPSTPVAVFSLRQPEIVTSDEFTCYDCLTLRYLDHELIRRK